MHEFSLVNALIDQVDRHLPAGATLRRVKVRAGAMQAIEPQAMQWAWQAATQGTRMDGATLELTIEPFALTCPECRRQWESDDIYDTCPCGCQRPRPTGAHALTLLSITMDQPDAQEVSP